MAAAWGGKIRAMRRRPAGVSASSTSRRSVLGTMTVAIAKVHGPKGFFLQNGGYEYNLVLIIAALTLALVGPGAFSLDHLLGLAR
jgi:putative oxidoreductase